MIAAAPLRALKDVPLLEGLGDELIAKRVAAALLPYSSDAPGIHPADPALQKITQIQLAAMVGSVKEVIARTIADFEASGALRRERGHIAYLNREALMHLAMDT